MSNPRTISETTAPRPFRPLRTAAIVEQYIQELSGRREPTLPRLPRSLRPAIAGAPCGPGQDTALATQLTP